MDAQTHFLWMTLKVLSRIGQVVCRTALYWDLSGVSLKVGLG